jgi:hypothetical protein
MGLLVKKSNIPGAGKGLFATKDFKKNATIGFYDGRRVTQATLDEHYGEKSTAPYTVKSKDGLFLDAACARSLMSTANASRNLKGSNAKFSSSAMADGTVKISATKGIKKDSEILLYYGKDYWRGAPSSHHTTK